MRRLILPITFFLLTAVTHSQEIGPLEDLEIKTSKGTFKLQVEIADDPEERAQGLMHRKSLPKDYGMLFDFGQEQPVSFWMKNTYVSLDMIFIRKNGTVASIERNTEPLSEEGVPSGAAVRFVLEVEAGVADELGVEVGDKIRHERIRN